MRYHVKRVLASSGFCTVEHYEVRVGSNTGQRLSGHWSRVDAEAAIERYRAADRRRRNLFAKEGVAQ